MKKLSIEEKAKAYDIALKKIEMLLGSGSSCSREELECVFPQLKESEYEKVRKEILQELKDSEDSIILSPFKRERWISWLESQGEKSETDVQGVYSETLFRIATVLSQHEDKEGSPLEKIREIMVDGACCAMDSEKNESKKSEQKPAWNEEDERLCLCLIENQEEALDKVNNDKYGQSEIISDLKEMYDERINWLKAIKERIQPKSIWKPSDGQMKALDDVISSRDIKYDVLSELWNDLNKLKKV